MNSMSFGDLPFAGGHVGITQETCRKYMKNIARQTPNMSPRGDSPLTKQIRAQSGGEKRPKPISSKLYRTHVEAQGKEPTKDGVIWA